MKKRVYLLSNSQGTRAGLMEDEKSYPQLLKEILPEIEFHYLLISGKLITDFYSNLENLLLVHPDLVIFQTGITDCARRILSDREKKILSLIPLSRVITKFLHDHRKTVIKLRNRLGINTRSVSLGQFEQTHKKIHASLTAHNIKVLYLEIPNFSQKYEDQYYPLINEDIEIYNKILRNYGARSLFNSSDDILSIWQSETVHWNASGHVFVAQRLVKMIHETMLIR